MFFCDPPGHTGTEHLFNFGEDTHEHNYIFFHDQEPTFPDIHKNLFDDVERRNQDLNFGNGPLNSAIVTSELNSQELSKTCDHYGWKSYYYFFHGWAALDWFRGYDRSFLIPEIKDRKITHGFVSPNRIIGGHRDHRVLLMYHLLKNKMGDAHVSMPAVCPVENVAIMDIAAKYQSIYLDINETLSSAEFPINFAGESGSPMHSCWLSLFDECASSLVYAVTETVFFEKTNHLTEKTFKPICLKMPFVIASAAGSLEYLRRYGFKTFSEFWSEDYDTETDNLKRLEMVGQLLCDLSNLSLRELSQLAKHTTAAVEYNHKYFYSSAFERLLWVELINMFEKITKDFQ